MNNKQTPNLFAGFECLLFAISALVLLVIVFAPARANAQDKKEKKAQTHKDTTTDDKVYEVCEQMPIFPGGDAAMMKYLSENVKYPALAIKAQEQGRVVVSFTVEKDGAISGVKVARSVTPSLDAEAVRVVKAMPKWTPGKQGGQLVRVRYNVPVSFKLN